MRRRGVSEHRFGLAPQRGGQELGRDGIELGLQAPHAGDLVGPRAQGRGPPLRLETGHTVVGGELLDTALELALERVGHHPLGDADEHVGLGQYQRAMRRLELLEGPTQHVDMSGGDAPRLERDGERGCLGEDLGPAHETLGVTKRDLLRVADGLLRVRLGGAHGGHDSCIERVAPGAQALRVGQRRPQ